MLNPYLAVWSDQVVAFARGSPTQYRKYEAKFAHMHGAVSQKFS